MPASGPGYEPPRKPTPLFVATDNAANVELALVGIVCATTIFQMLFSQLRWQIPALMADTRATLIFNVSLVVGAVTVVISVIQTVSNFVDVIWLTNKHVVETLSYVGATDRYIVRQLESMVRWQCIRSIWKGLIVTRMFYIVLLEVFQLVAPLSRSSFLTDAATILGAAGLLSG